MLIDFKHFYERFLIFSLNIIFHTAAQSFEPTVCVNDWPSEVKVQLLRQWQPRSHRPQWHGDGDACNEAIKPASSRASSQTATTNTFIPQHTPPTTNPQWATTTQLRPAVRISSCGLHAAWSIVYCRVRLQSTEYFLSESASGGGASAEGMGQSEGDRSVSCRSNCHRQLT